MLTHNHTCVYRYGWMVSISISIRSNTKELVLCQIKNKKRKEMGTHVNDDAYDNLMCALSNTKVIF